MYLAGYRYVSYQVFIHYPRATNNYPADTNEQAGKKNTTWRYGQDRDKGGREVQKAIADYPFANAERLTEQQFCKIFVLLQLSFYFSRGSAMYIL